MNNATIAYLEEMKQNTDRNRIISKILEDEACFFKMKKEDAYEILEQIGVEKSKTGKVYNGLISEQTFYKLKRAGKIKDEECVVFDITLNNDIFNKNKVRPNKTEQQHEQSSDIVKYKESKFKNIFKRIKDFFNQNANL